MSRSYRVDLSENEDGSWTATIEHTQGASCVSHGQTVDVALERIREALGLYLDNELAAVEAYLVPNVLPSAPLDGHTPRELWTTAAAAQRLGCSEAHVYELCASGQLEGAFQTEGDWRIPLASLEAFSTARG